MELKTKDLTVKFATFGGALTSIKDADGIEYLWQGDATYWSGQAPVLFPICGSVKNDTVKYGTEVTGKIPRHGLVRKKEFELVGQTGNSITFAIESSEDTLANYPYHFRLEITYIVEGKTVRTQYKVINKETQKTMPFFIGGHPGFNCPLLPDEQYEDYYLEFDQVETCSVPKSFPETGLLDVKDRTELLYNQKTLPLDYALFSHDAITLDKLQSRVISLKSRKHDKGLSLNFKEFNYLILWSTTNKGPFIALEPWSGLSTSLEEGESLESKKNVRYLEPGESAELGFDITIF